MKTREMELVRLVQRFRKINGWSTYTNYNIYVFLYIKELKENTYINLLAELLLFFWSAFVCTAYPLPVLSD